MSLREKGIIGRRDGGSGEGMRWGATCLWCVEREACVRIDNHKDVADVRLRSA
jgi:hypothetical protein